MGAIFSNSGWKVGEKNVSIISLDNSVCEIM